MNILDRLRAAYAAFRNFGQKADCTYSIYIGDDRYPADSYRIDKYSGLPEWEFAGDEGKFRLKAYPGWILEELLSR